MSAWFTVAVSPKVGSLAAVTSALAAAGIPVDGIMGAPESDGSLHLGVPDAQLQTAIAALTALGLQPVTEESDPTGEAGAPLDAGIIGAILRGPRS
jgi:aspartokinase